ncbi:hypothetical protein [uncultured Sphingomonas sp.]|uniref:hypothetical protein n=1 Tax=uncultured Sphingomonas sp. TaxID=158754 RepID=UPI0025DF6E68|nr:hypothetical protein [uncultured Sphingomonas sp.]
MREADANTIYREAIASLRHVLALCDDHDVGGVALPHVDLALNLLKAEHRARTRVTDPAPL